MKTYKDFCAIMGLQAGMSIWVVYAVIRGVENEAAFICEFKIVDVPFISEDTGTYFLKVQCVDTDKTKHISLDDSGFPSGNTYNDHCLCLSKIEADIYRHDVINGRVKSRITTPSDQY